MNSLIQMLFAIKPLRDAILSAGDNEDECKEQET
jgi:hypothetical protein